MAVKFKVLEIGTAACQPVLTVYTSLLVGLKYLPEHAEKSLEEWLDIVHSMQEADQRKVIESAFHIVRLSPEDISDCLRFCADANGVPFTEVNSKGLLLTDIKAMVTEVCMAIARMKITLVTETEKKKSETSQLMSEESLQGIQA